MSKDKGYLMGRRCGAIVYCIKGKKKALADKSARAFNTI
jgi:hypothetical protein